MPRVIHGHKKDALLQQATDIASYLAELKVAAFNASEAGDDLVSRGEVLFEDLGCIACHRFTPPDAEGTQFRHIEVYAYRRTVIENFVLLPQSLRERQQKLQQLRALDAGMRVDAALVDMAPARVDTPADLERVRARLSSESQRPLR